MKKLLLTLSLVLGFITLAQATDVTLPGTDKKWYDETYTWDATDIKVTGSVEGFTLDINKGSSQTAPKAPNSTDKNYNAVVVYAGSNLKVTAPQGRSISKLVVNAGSGTKDVKTICVNNNTNNNWTVSTTGTGTSLVATLTATTAQQSITFYGADYGPDGITTSKQLRIKSMVITLDDGTVVTPTVDTPVFSVAAGAVEKGTEVSISCGTDAATIHYTIDGSDVDANSPVYSTAIVINEAMTIKAKAFKEGMTASEQAVASYSLSQSVDPEQPVITSTATFNFSDPTTLTPSYDANANHDVDGVIFSNNNVTVVNEKNKASNTAKLWANGHQYRIYSSSILKIAVKEGYKLTSISFECTEGLKGLSDITPGSFDPSTGVLTFNNVTANEVTCTLSEKVFITKITVKYAAVASAPAAPVLTMPEGYNTESPVNLTEYSKGEVKYFDVTVSWTEGMKLVYEVSARGTMLNGTTLEYPEQSEEPSTPAAVRANGPAKVALKNPVTGTISDASSAVFSFASDGEFSCYVVDAAGNQSDKKPLTFQGQSTGVEDIIANGADGGEAVFYNMQGVRVANPAAGNLYIKVQGDKATKVLVK